MLERAANICFPAGVYRASRLRIPSGTTVYLAPGAAIRAIGTGVGKSAPFLDLSGSENVGIHGPGTIDGNAQPYHLVQTERSRDITLEDVLVRNCTSWAIHLLLVEDVVCRNVRVLSGKDGIDPDCAKDVTIENVFIMSKDDAVALKTRKPPHSTERVVVRESIVASDASALKVGTETRALMRDITFERCDVFDSDRGIILYARDGGPIENVTWRDIRLFMIDWPHETGGAPMQFEITERSGLTPVRSCSVENISTNVVVPCSFEGLGGAPLDGLRLRNITLRASRPRDAGRHLLDVGSSVDAGIEGLIVEWGRNRSLWAGVVSGSGLRTRDLEESETAPSATGESVRDDEDDEDDEVEVSFDELPAVVQRAVRSLLAANEEIDEIERERDDGYVIYDVDAETEDDREIEIHIRADGTLHRRAIELRLADVPDPVRATVLREAGDGGEIDEVRRITDHEGAVWYEAEIETAGGVDIDVEIAESGRVLERDVD